MPEKDFYQISLKLFLKNKKGEVLVLRAVDAGTLKGFYDFPGGRVHVEEFKTPLLKILKREVKEEIGDVDFEIKPRPIAWGRHEISAAFSSSGKAIHIFYGSRLAHSMLE